MPEKNLTAWYTMATFTSSNTSFMSPVVTTFESNGFININTSTQDQITVTGIDEKFMAELSGNDVYTMLNSFNVSGVSIDRRLGRDDVDLESLNVTMVGGKEADFKTLIKRLLGSTGGALNGTNQSLDAWLAVQLKQLFQAAFTMLGGSQIDLSGELTGIGSTVPGTAGDAVGDASDGTLGASALLTAGALTLSTINSTVIGEFSVDVLTDVSGAADNCWTQHNSGANVAQRRSLFRQIPKENLLAYALDSSGAAVTPLKTTALPLVHGNKLSYLFVVDVTTAGKNAGDAAPENAPVANETAPGSNVSVGIYSFSANLPSKNIQLELTFADANSVTSAGNPYLVGAGALVNALTATYDYFPDGGAGTNPSSSA